MHRTLTPDDLRWCFPSEEFGETDLKPAEKDRHGRPGALGQERALVALELGLGDRDRPHSVTVPPGSGPKVKKRYDAFVEKMLTELEKSFESEGYIAKRNQIDAHHQERTDQLLEGIEGEANARGFILSRTGNALTLSVGDSEGNPLPEDA